jgi:hypothetical protein
VIKSNCRRSAILAVLCLTTASACSDSTGPRFTRDYRLITVNGVAVPSSGVHAALGGSIRLERNGTAIRRVTYQMDTAGTQREFIAVGTYRISGTRLVLGLREDNGKSEYVWRPFATLKNDVITIQHPDPADGPDIVEVYTR